MMGDILKHKRKYMLLSPLVFVGVFIFGLFFVNSGLKTKQSQAACCLCTTNVAVPFIPYEAANWVQTFFDIQLHMSNEVTALQSWMVSTLFEDNILPAMMLMTEQMSSVAMLQMQAVGSFFDAKHQMETQQVFQKLQARAHKDYHPSTGMCEFGSSVKSLSASERRGEYNAVLMAQRSQDRALGNAYSVAARGEASDKESRIKQFREKFCDPSDNNSGLGYMCEHDQDHDLAAPVGAEDSDRMNKDIDFVRTVDTPWTLNVDFTDELLTDHEEEVLALASNLYNHDLFTRPPPVSLRNYEDQLTDAQKFYMDSRSIIAKRSVAENSFNAITAMKSKGTPGSMDFLNSILAEILDDPADAKFILGSTVDLSDPTGTRALEPSYYAQMEVLTKKLYQNPDFYTDLYDKPVNVDRKKVSMQAIGLMQKFDLFKSYLRKEASLSLLLELSVMELQEDIENELNTMKSGG